MNYLEKYFKKIVIQRLFKNDKEKVGSSECKDLK